jgi:hypothetical protein
VLPHGVDSREAVGNSPRVEIHQRQMLMDQISRRVESQGSNGNSWWICSMRWRRDGISGSPRARNLMTERLWDSWMEASRDSSSSERSWA